MRDTLALLATLSFTTACPAAETTPLPRAAPETQGIPSAAVLAFVEAAEEAVESLHSFMLLRRGVVVAEGWWEPYGAETPHVLYSLSKSFASTAAGLAVAEGKLSVDDAVLPFFLEDGPADPSRNLRAMRVSDLLRMSTGHETEPPRPEEASWKKAFLAHPVPFKPGTHFKYNTSATYMLAAIVEQVTGQDLVGYLTPRLFGPLGIAEPRWDKSPEGITIGGYGLRLTTEDIARTGQLYLQKGAWGGRQILPASWVEEATGLRTSNGSNPASDWDQGYGYQFWRSRHGAYRGDGAFGQYCIVMPDQETVIAITGGLANMQQPLDLVWEKLLPALGPEALPPDPEAHARLRAKLAGLSLIAPGGDPPPADLPGTVFTLPENPAGIETIAPEAGPGGSTVLVVRSGATAGRIVFGRDAWTRSRAPWGGEVQPVAAGGGWSGGGSFSGTVCLYETPYRYKLNVAFSDGGLRLRLKPNVAFGGARESEVVGWPADPQKKNPAAAPPADPQPDRPARARGRPRTRRGPPPIELRPVDKPAFPPAPEGFDREREGIARGRVEAITYDSKTVGTERRAIVYTPPGYTADGRYPVLYLLHGIGGMEDTWWKRSHADVILDNLYADGKAAPMIVVMPNGRSDKSMGPRTPWGEQGPAFARFERELFDDLIPFIEKRYPVRPGSAHRALAGLSMGGGQSLNIGLRHLDAFDWIGAFSSAPNTRPMEELLPRPAEAVKKLRLLFLSCGDEDGLLRVSQRVQSYLAAAGVPHTWHLDDGGHTRAVWSNDLYLLAPLLFR